MRRLFFLLATLCLLGSAHPAAALQQGGYLLAEDIDRIVARADKLARFENAQQ
jgi:hypothetical protein